MPDILIDTDVVLHVLLREEPFFETSSEVFVRLEQEKIRGCITATTMTNIFYIARKRAGLAVARICVRKLLETRGLKFLSVDEQVLRNAEASEMTDFEDAVQASAAEVAGIGVMAKFYRWRQSAKACGLPHRDKSL
jgi:predicted nucleic acid-binding protein